MLPRRREDTNHRDSRFRRNHTLDTVFPGSLCVDGKTQPCHVPVNNSTGTNNHNCYLDGLNPTILPLRDNRGFHLHPLTKPASTSATTTSTRTFRRRAGSLGSDG